MLNDPSFDSQDPISSSELPKFFFKSFSSINLSAFPVNLKELPHRRDHCRQESYRKE
jgi:hypothetical protein